MAYRSAGPEDGVAWVTGAGKGLGRALALRLASAGWSVLASARTREDLDSLAKEARGLSGEILPLPLDVLQRDELAEALGRATAERPLALAVLNAGTHSPVLLDSFEAARIDPLIELNLRGTLNCLYAVLPAMRKRKRGQVAIVASVAGYFGLPTSAGYGMTKAGLINLAEALQPELALEGIHLQVINPGFVRTPLTEKNRFPMPFLMEPEAAAEAFFRGLSSRRFEIVFPWRMAAVMKLLRLLPYRLSLSLTRRLIPKEPMQ